ncbi:MAG: aspartate kinase [Planctomycetota bacterium]
MIVMKFGGTSLGTSDAVRRVVDIVRRVRHRRPVLVASAHAGITDSLEALARRGPRDAAEVTAIETWHRSLLADLGLAAELLEELWGELRDALQSVHHGGEASPRALDRLYSFGERCSVRVVAGFLSQQGLAARAVDAWDAGLRTDAAFGRARPLPDDGRMREFFAAMDEIPVVTGYIAKDADGNITTLGRNGSDYSAALIGHALRAEEIQIWKDVDGVMTADPKLVPHARPIPRMSFEEASELAYWGGRVLHPSALEPAIEGSIPVRVLNTSRPDLDGTSIVARFDEPGEPVRSIVHKRVHLVHLVAPGVRRHSAVLARMFDAAERFEIDTDVVSSSEASVTLTAAPAARTDEWIAALRQVGAVTVERDHALVSVVGRGVALDRGVAARVLATLAEVEVPVLVISQGANNVNLALVIAEAHLPRAVPALHDAFFPA